MLCIWKYLTNVCLFNEISQSDQTSKILVKLLAECRGRGGRDRPQDEIRNINIADRSQAGPEMYDGRADLNWTSGIFLGAIFG